MPIPEPTLGDQFRAALAAEDAAASPPETDYCSDPSCPECHIRRLLKMHGISYGKPMIARVAVVEVRERRRGLLRRVWSWLVG